MTECLFYHLERRALEDMLPGLVEKSLQRGWRAAIKTDSSERSDALDTLLWTISPFCRMRSWATGMRRVSRS